VKTIVDILERSDEWKRKFLLEGSSVQDGNFHHVPRMLGKWIGSHLVFDPDKHKLTFDVTMTNGMRETVNEEVGVEVLFVKTDGGAYISLVTDLDTHLTDGSITPNGDLLIQGDKIKIAPDGMTGLGVFFVAAEMYTLKIVTRFVNSRQLLNAPRTLTYELPLRVG
jgi:hypothetical protein